MPTAKFDQMALTLEKRVADGTYPAGSKLPSDYSLAEELGVSRLTVRKAIAALVDQQLLVKERRRGTFVMTDKIESGRGGLQGFTEAAAVLGKTATTEVLAFDPEYQAPNAVVQALDTKQPLMYVVRRRCYDNEPMTIEQLTLPLWLVEHRTQRDFEGSLFRLIEAQVPIAYSHQEVEAVGISPEIAALLNVPAGSPQLKVTSQTYAADGRPLLYDVSYYRADQYRFKNTLTRHQFIEKEND